ncbi:MAG: hypothetical protein IPJ88_11770 [Myxococcales bacterium]|nr:MAG: hypothetical protein IPJ88_11770 [Myxococcales bacterium]
MCFSLEDFVHRVSFRVFGSDSASEAAEDLGLKAGKYLLEATDPEMGWPPQALRPALSPPIAGEGKWLVIKNDPYVRSYPGSPAAFVQTFIRTDEERRFTRVYITMWDPRQVQLHIAMGTKEPESATGETGTGRILAMTFTMRHLVGALTVGFRPCMVSLE